MKRIKRTKITVIRTESVFLKMQSRAAEYAREFLSLPADDSEENENRPVSENNKLRKEPKTEEEAE